MNWRNQRVLVTGADGFIGSHLAEALASAGADVTALALYNSFDSYGWLDDVDTKLRSAMRLVRGDVRDPHQMMSLCRNQDVVFHLAALIAIPYSYDAPSSYVQTNVQGTTNVLSAALAAGVGRVVNTSTSEVYGTARVTPMSEDHPLQAQSPYAASKVGADMIAESFARSFNLPVVTLRPFNTYGPRQSERAVIATIIRQILDDACPEIHVGSVDPRRDFNFVADTVAAFLNVAAIAETNPGVVFNAGSGRMVTIGEMIEMARRLTNCTKSVIQDEQRQRPTNSEVMVLMADSRRLERVTGWRPAVTLENGLARTVTWWRERMTRVRLDRSYIT